MSIYFKDELHRADFKRALLSLERSVGDRYYDSFCYLLAASGKLNILGKHLSDDGIEYEDILKDVEVFSGSEQGMIKLALQLFNSNMSNITLHEAVRSLDKENLKCVLQAIEIRYV